LHVSCDGKFLAPVADSAAARSSLTRQQVLSLSEAAIVNLLSLQLVSRKRDRWSGLVVMVMGELFKTVQPKTSATGLSDIKRCCEITPMTFLART
jgi:hypothetical protein